MKRKKMGYMAWQVMIAMIACMMASYGLFLSFSSGFGMLAATKDAVSAQQYAEITANTLRLCNYDDLDDQIHDRQPITVIENPDGWEDEIILGDEKDMADGTNFYRIATVNIYKDTDTTPRFTLNVPLSSQDAGKVSLNSTIIIGQTYGSNYLPVPDTWDKSKTLAFVSLAEIHHLHKDSEFATVCYVDSNFYVTAYTYQYDGGCVRQQKVNYLLIYLG